MTVNAFVNFIKNETTVEQRVTAIQYKGYDDVPFALYAIRKEDEVKMQNDPRMIAMINKEKEIVSRIKPEEDRIRTNNKGDG